MIRILIRKFYLCVILGSLALSLESFALDSVTPADFSSLSQVYVNEMAKIVAIGTDAHAYHPASPLGTFIGLDIGVDVTAVKVSSTMKEGLALVTGKSAESQPQVLPVPRFSLHKGLPQGIDLGIHYAKLSVGGSEVYKTFGGEISWAYLRQPGKWNASVRVSGTSSQVYFIKGSCYDFDGIFSYPLLSRFVEPYVGLGMQLWSGELEVPVGVPSYPVTVTGKDSGFTPHFYAGLMLKFFVLKLVPQFEYNTAKITTYGLKVALSF